ncbi:peptidoglycan-binding protein LysM [Chelatococcus sp. SYSU_G07232]|uniref:Peptidoglycan-binding protein LysM n=1 Tax=Chelatococcus albus TaxID=3047466 RepID=A0ABT7AGM5_9HYPH|nr:peptidoglycan-binding protein LysM [Chelatococcus sp. SYSU_G07232]MDJ1158521.1 peptidoglycan-binding protein LysM [Chelatococcus sp. SYSU_G07232]
MGLFSFIKEAGERLFGASEAKAASAEDLKKEVEKHGLKADGLSITVDGDKVKVSGQTASTEEAEKIILALGNTIGVAEVEEQLAVIRETPKARMYTVKKGDTLWRIAEEIYGRGNGTRHTAIFEANRPMLAHPDKIYPGQVLRIPPLA